MTRLYILTAVAAMAAQPPESWVDADTGHRVVRLTNEPGSASLYFNQNGYTADGKKLVYTTPNGISVLDLEAKTARQVVEGRVRLIDAGRKTQRVFYLRDGAAFWTNVDTGETKKIADLPRRGGISTINADETLLAGTYIEGEGQDYNRGPTAATQGHPLDQPRNKGQMMEDRWAARLPMGLYTLNVNTGEVKTIHKANDWLNHLLFSPTDPTMLMFCHEGPWHKVDRIWLMRTDGSMPPKKIHARTMAMEIWGTNSGAPTARPSGSTCRSRAARISGWQATTSIQASAHGITCSATSGPSTSTSRATAHSSPATAAIRARWRTPRTASGFIFSSRNCFRIAGSTTKALCVRRAAGRAPVNMSKHQYRLEPNVSFTPDQKWVVFRSNMFGDTYVFAVEVVKSR
jgi:oligogalacturonide lyase